MNIRNDTKAQISAEYILLISGIMIIVLIVINIYQNYMMDFEKQINDNELNNLINKIDEIKNYI